MPTLPDESPITAAVHGLRNQCARFKGGPVELLVGSMSEHSYAGIEACVLLTLEGRDEDGQVIDIEIAVRVSQVRELVARIVERADLKDA